MAAIETIAADGSYRGHKADFLDGTAFSPEEFYLTVGAFSEIAPWLSDYTGQQIYYHSIQQPERGLPHDQGLPVAVGHRLVLVLARVRRAAAADPPRCGRAASGARTCTASWSPSTNGTSCPARSSPARRPPREPVIQDVEIPVERSAPNSSSSSPPASA